MEIIKTDFDSVFIIEPKLFGDNRGYFFETYSKRDFDEKACKVLGECLSFVQDNESKSRAGVMRGFHFQNPPYSQSKLVRCVRGRILDFALDLRKESKSYGNYIFVELSESNHHCIFIPKGFAHAFIALEDDTIINYKCDEFYHPESESGINLFDDKFKIKDILASYGYSHESIILSEKDKKYPNLADFISPF